MDTTSQFSCHNLRILFVGQYPPPFGGIATHLVSLIPSLVDHSASDIAVISFDKGNRLELVNEIPIYRFDLKKNFRILANPKQWLLIARVVKDLGYRGIGFSRLIKEMIATILVNEIAKKHKSNVVSIYHSTNLMVLPLSNLWRNKRSIVLTVFGEVYGSSSFMNRNRSIIGKVISVPQAVVATSYHCASSFSNLGINRTIEPVYYGVDLGNVTSPEDRQRFREENNIKPDEVVLLFMGRFLVEMGLDVILSSAKTLFEKSTNLRLLLAGAKGDLSEQATALANKFPEKIIVMQDVSFAKQRFLYSAADVLVAPSFDQRACMGIAIKEAMAARLPVIGGAGGGVPEAIVDGENGFLIPLDSTGTVDRKLFIDSILRLVADSELRLKMGKAGRARVENLFSVKRTNLRMSEIFMNALPR